MQNKTHLIERLEDRIAPAVLVNPTTVKFIDVDGDDVTVHISKALFTKDNFDDVLSFIPSQKTLPGGVSGEYLSQFDVKQLGLAATGMDITVTAKRSVTHGGNGLVDIGSIDAFDKNNPTSVDLGRVRVQGDVNFIDAGDAILSTPAIKSIDIGSIGKQISGVKSEINGGVSTVLIRGDMFGNFLQTFSLDNKLSSFTILGSLGSAELAGERAGSVTLGGTIGVVKIAHNIVGGQGFGSGSLEVGGTVGSINIGGSVIGGTAGFTGGVTFSGKTALVHVGGSVIGGDVGSSGFLQSGNGSTVGTVKVDGSVIGGLSQFSGGIVVDRLTALIVGHDVIGKTGESSGFIQLSSAKTILVKGSLHGVQDPGDVKTTANFGGSIFARESLGTVTILGDLTNASITAGVTPGTDKQFGVGSGTDADVDSNLGLISSIARVIIKGSVNSAGSTHYAIESNQIGLVQVGGVTYAHTNKLLDFHAGFNLNAKGSVSVREI